MKGKPLRRKCRICKTPFTTADIRVWWCCYDCGAKYAIRQREKQKKAQRAKERKETREQREKAKTLNQLKSEAQKVFNRYIRSRDLGKECISCNTVLRSNVKYDAGHLYPVGHYDSIRFDERNVHGQCVRCNHDLHGNQAEYLLRLPGRIGQDAVNQLNKSRHQVVKLSRDEVVGIKRKYQTLLRQMINK